MEDLVRRVGSVFVTAEDHLDLDLLLGPKVEAFVVIWCLRAALISERDYLTIHEATVAKRAIDHD